jgi:hypothetical protein
MHGDEEDRYPYVPGHVNTDTSEEAADSMLDHVGRLQGMVLEHLAKRQKLGATDWELERDLGLRHQTVSARRREMELRGFVRNSGEKRLTDSGRRAIVWVLTT